jgi:hypothetical protein
MKKQAGATVRTEKPLGQGIDYRDSVKGTF